MFNVSIHPTLSATSSLDDKECDALILIHAPEQQINSAPVEKAVTAALQIDPSLKSEIAILPLPELPAGRLVYVPTGSLDPDYDDVRCLKTCAYKGIKRALKAGINKPLLILQENPNFEDGELVTILGALEALYTPIQVRENQPDAEKIFPKLSPIAGHKIERLYIYTSNVDKTSKLIKQAELLEYSRRVACDIGDADPERMSPVKVEEYVSDLFAKQSLIKMHVVKDVEEFSKDYPLFEAVNRAASVVERHRGRIIFLEYDPVADVKETLFLVGKGVTYDTGGADVKTGGAMLGMSRDKCGAAAVAGFMKLVDLVRPNNLRVVAAMSMVRNSIGSNSYVADEVITARSGARVRIINTDAEGRMVMADVLCQFKEAALKAVNPHLYTIATLTGHAARTVGDGYSIVMDNGPAKKSGHAQKLQLASELIGDPFEISTIRREDFASHRGVAEGDDVVQGHSKPSTQSDRGHQGPAAFLILASGLDKCGSGSKKPLKYSHLDIAASGGSLPNPATGSPLLALAKTYLFRSFEYN